MPVLRFKNIRLYLCNLLLLLAFGTAAQERTVLSYSFYNPKDSSRVFDMVKQGLALIDEKPEQALTLFRKAEQLGRTSGFDDGVGYALSFTGLTEGKLGHPEKSKASYAAALPYCLQARACKFVIAFLYMNMGLTFKEQGDYNHANEYFHKALASFQRYLPEHKSIIAVYINLIGIQARMGSAARALDYADQATQLARKHGQQHYLALALLNKGNTLYTIKLPDSALYYYRAGLEVATAAQDSSIYSSFYLSMGNAALEKQQDAEAIHYFEKVIALNQDKPSATLFGYILPRYSLGLAYKRQKAYKKAEQVLLEGLAKAEQTGLTENEHDGRGVLTDVYREMGRYKEALEQGTLYQKLRDSAGEEKKVQAINELEIRYHTAQKDKEIIQKQVMIARQEKTISRNNIIIGSTAGGLLLLVGGGLAFYRNKRKMERRNAEISRLKAAAAGEEKERARISRELHDGLGGMLTGIKMNLRTLQKQAAQPDLPQKLEEIMSQLQGMGDEIRKTAHNLMPDILQEHNLQQALQLYCNQLSTDRQQVSLQFHGTPDLADKSLELVVYRIVQELVQNIVKHAQASLAEIQVIHNKETLCISAEDNGIGFEQEQGNGLGLQNIRSRVQALNGYCSITSAPGKGTTAFIEIDLKNDRN